MVPIRDFVERTDDDVDDFLSRMFEQYKSTPEESIGRYARGETEIPLEKQAGRIGLGVAGRLVG